MKDSAIPPTHTWIRGANHHLMRVNALLASILAASLIVALLSPLAATAAAAPIAKSPSEQCAKPANPTNSSNEASVRPQNSSAAEVGVRRSSDSPVRGRNQSLKRRRILFGWARIRSGSIWPAVIGHGALNASGGLVLIVGEAGAPMSMALVNPISVSGMIVLAVVVVVLFLTGQVEREPQFAAKRD